jgi:hypothetical protein
MKNGLLSPVDWTTLADFPPVIGAVANIEQLQNDRAVFEEADAAVHCRPGTGQHPHYHSGVQAPACTRG